MSSPNHAVLHCGCRPCSERPAAPRASCAWRDDEFELAPHHVAVIASHLPDDGVRARSHATSNNCDNRAVRVRRISQGGKRYVMSVARNQPNACESQLRRFAELKPELLRCFGQVCTRFGYRRFQPSMCPCANRCAHHRCDRYQPQYAKNFRHWNFYELDATASCRACLSWMSYPSSLPSFSMSLLLCLTSFS